MKRVALAVAGSFVLAGLMAGPALALTPEAAEAQAKVRAIGKVWNLDVNNKSREIYVPILQKSPRDGVKVTSDLKYGPDAKHRLDIHEPAARPSRPMPVVVFIHGGGLTGGDKDSVNTPAAGLIYGNVPTYFARNGMLGVNATYRLVPNVQYPGGPADMAAIVEYLKKNVAQYGGDPNAIFLFGQSAGGTHVGAYLYESQAHKDGGPGIAGAIILSGAVGPDGIGPRERVATQYYGEDKAKWAANVATGLLDRYKGKMVPTFILTAELDPVSIEAPGIALLSKLCAMEAGCPRYMQVQGHNHITTALHINTSDDTLGPHLLDFVRRTVSTQMASR